MPIMFHPENLDTMSYQQLYQLQDRIVKECSAYEQEEAWTHYGLTSDSFTHAHLKRKKECRLCNKRFYKSLSLMTHLKNSHSVAMTKRPKRLKNQYVFTCVVCAHPFSNIKDINEHKSAGHTELCIVSNCQAGFTTKNDLDKHLKTIHKIIQWKTIRSDEIYLTKAQV